MNITRRKALLGIATVSAGGAATLAAGGKAKSTTWSSGHCPDELQVQRSAEELAALMSAFHGTPCAIHIDHSCGLIAIAINYGGGPVT